MDPITSSIIVGLLTNCLYSSILSTSDKVQNYAFRREEIYKHLLRNKVNFDLIVEEVFQELPLAIKYDELNEFFQYAEVEDIVRRIYYIEEIDPKNLTGIESIESDFCLLVTQHFGKNDTFALAPKLFFALLRCCQESLTIIVSEEESLSAHEALSCYRHRRLLELLQEINKKLDIHLQKSGSKSRALSHKHLFINMAPDPKDYLVKRPYEYKQLINSLLETQEEKTVAITTAIFGAGGFGKTTFAKALCHDKKVIDKFSDGILWVTLGEKPKSLIGHVRDLIYALSHERPDFEDLNSAVFSLKELLNEKRFLIVIDDVWNKAHLEPFLEGGPKCVRLITTRINETLPADSIEIPVDTMHASEAVELLKSGISINDCAGLEDLARKLGKWPLLLKLTNSALKQHIRASKNVDRAIDYVKMALEKKGPKAFDAKNPESRHQAVAATLSVSFELLSEEEFTHYNELAIFPEDEDIQLKVLAKLWGKTGGYDSFEVETLCLKLSNLSLLQTYNIEKEIIRLHDVMREYLIRENQKRLLYFHVQFLEAYNIDNLYMLPTSELYIWKYMGYHLVEAGMKDNLRELLLNFNWQQSKLKATDIDSLISDYNYIVDDPPIQIVQGAIRLSTYALASSQKHLGGQLLGRLKSTPNNEIQSLLKQITEQKVSISLVPISCSLTSPGGPLINTVAGHSDGVISICVTPDGTKIISGSLDKTIRVWNLENGTELQTIKGHYAPISSVCVTPDGKKVVSSSFDKTIRIWDLENGTELQTMKGHYSPISSVCITPDGNKVVSASLDTTIRIWDLESGKELQTLRGHSRGVRSVCVTKDGTKIVSASNDKTLKVWDIKSGKELKTLRGHRKTVRSVCITTNGAKAISVSDDRTLKIWNLKSGDEIKTLRGHSSKINSVCIISDGTKAISASDDRILKVWDLNNGNEIQTLRGHSGRLRSVCATPCGTKVVSASLDSTIRIWTIKCKMEPENFKGHFDRVRSILITPDGTKAISASDDKTLKVWDLKNGNEIQTLRGHSKLIRSFCITQDGTKAISASNDGTIRVWDINNGKELKFWKEHYHGVRSVCVTQEGTRTVSVSLFGTIKISDIKDGRSLRYLYGYGEFWCKKAAKSVYLTPDGTRVISTFDDGTLCVWNLRSGKELQNFIGHNDEIRSVCFTPDGTRVISASDDGTIRVWSLVSGAELQILSGHSEGVKSVCTTPDGTRVISASSDKTIRVWDLVNGREIQNMKGHIGVIRSVCVTSDGNYVVSASEDRALKVWCLKNGKEVSSFVGEGSLLNCAISDDGSTIVTGEATGRVHILRLENACDQ